jgi:hypothetical protein
MFEQEEGMLCHPHLSGFQIMTTAVNPTRSCATICAS